MQDVWVVTEWQVLEWMRNPTTLDQIANFPPWQCNDPQDIRRLVDGACQIPNYCHLTSAEIKGDRYMGQWRNKLPIDFNRIAQFVLIDVVFVVICSDLQCLPITISVPQEPIWPGYVTRTFAEDTND